MTPELFDTHCHLDYDDFKEDQAEVIQRATDAGVTRMIAVGTDFPSSRAAIGLAERYDSVWAAVGWHPGHAEEAPETIVEELRALANHPRVVAIGETGLDYFRLPKRDTEEAKARRARISERQQSLFRQHLEVAAELGLNCVIHQRACFEDTIRLFRPFANRVRAVFHCFANPVVELEQVLELGSYVSFTGLVTFKQAVDVHASAAAVPEDRFMVETDAPFLAPVPERGKRCEPAYVRLTATELARLRGCSLESLAERTCETAKTFFRGSNR